MNRLNVYLGNQPIGDLEQDSHGRLSFTYLPGVRHRLSLRLPVRPEPYDDLACRAFFSNLLPEGAALEAAAQARRLQNYQVFELLSAYGRDCSGAVSLVPDGADATLEYDYEEMADDEMAEALTALPSSPNFALDLRVRMSLGGAQKKLGVAILDGKIMKPIGGAPSTHIVKASGQYKHLVLNEAFCMAAAQKLGIGTAKTEIRTFGNQPCLFVTRYDRRIDAHGRVQRLHQEDFCQILGYPPHLKYEFDNDGNKRGPGLAEIFGALGLTRHPVLAQPELARRTIFNFLVGNADAHAKNFSLLYDEDTDVPTLAPAYDIVCTRLYPELDQEFAMAIGNARRPEQLTAGDILNMLGGRIQRAISRIAIDTARQIGPAVLDLRDTKPFTRFPPFHDICALAGDRARQIGELFGIEIEPGTPPFGMKAGGWLRSS